MSEWTLVGIIRTPYVGKRMNRQTGWRRTRWSPNSIYVRTHDMAVWIAPAARVVQTVCVLTFHVYEVSGSIFFFFFNFLVVYCSLWCSHINSKWPRPKRLIDSNPPLYPVRHKVLPKRIITVALVTINSVHYLHFSGVDFCIDSPGLIFSKNSTRKLVKRNKPAMI